MNKLKGKGFFYYCYAIVLLPNNLILFGASVGENWKI